MIMERKGFTLIEILIVVAIIAILASIVLVGLGPTQALGRDARRAADLHEVQNALELYYNKNGTYVTGMSGKNWSDFTAVLVGAGIAINALPDDPSSGKHYRYGSDAAGTTYILEANMESDQDSFWSNYQTPNNIGAITDVTAGTGGLTCKASPDKQFCQAL